MTHERYTSHLAHAIMTAAFDGNFTSITGDADSEFDRLIVTLNTTLGRGGRNRQNGQIFKTPLIIRLLQVLRSRL
jgi:hypothetical protein